MGYHLMGGAGYAAVGSVASSTAWRAAPRDVTFERRDGVRGG